MSTTTISIISWNVLSQDLVQPQMDAWCKKGPFYPSDEIFDDKYRYEKWKKQTLQWMKEEQIISFQELPDYWYFKFEKEEKINCREQYHIIIKFYPCIFDSRMSVALFIPKNKYTVIGEICISMEELFYNDEHDEIQKKWSEEEMSFWRQKRKPHPFLSVHVKTKDDEKKNIIISTSHFPCWFYMPNIMSYILKKCIDSLLSWSFFLFEKNQKKIHWALFGDFNMMPKEVNDTISSYFISSQDESRKDAAEIYTFFTEESKECTTICVGNRDPDQPYNKNCFFGCLDHMVWGKIGGAPEGEEKDMVKCLSKLPFAPDNMEMWKKEMYLPCHSFEFYPDVIPNQNCISDHYPLLWSITIN